MNPKSFKVKRLSVPSGSGRNIVLQVMFSTHFNYENEIGGHQDTSHHNTSAYKRTVRLTIVVKFI